jgi:hypothetical protein
LKILIVSDNLFDKNTLLRSFNIGEIEFVENYQIIEEFIMEYNKSALLKGYSTQQKIIKLYWKKNT